VPQLRGKCLALCFLDVLGAVGDEPVSPAVLAGMAGFDVRAANDGAERSGPVIIVSPRATRAEVTAVVARELAKEAIRWAGEYGAEASQEAVEDALMRYFVESSAVCLRPISVASG
jgi:hypothetical protein